jgi:hypothetical protein
MTTEQLLFEISEKLDRILGFLAIRNVGTTGDQVKVLADLGLDSNTIAAVTGLTTNAVSVRLSRMRRRTR